MTSRVQQTFQLTERFVTFSRVVNISKQALGEKQLHKLFTQLHHTIEELNAKQSALFLEDFLGEEEQIMLAKRLAAILMLHHGQSLYACMQLPKH